MKSFATPLALLAALGVQGTAARPGNGRWSNSTDVSGDVHTEAITVSVNCNELVNQVLSGISAYPEFTAQAVAVGKKVGVPAGTAFSVCKMFKTDAIDCGYAAGSVAGAISLAITNGFIDLIDEGSDPANPSRKRALESFQDKLETYMRQQGAEFDLVTVAETTSTASNVGAAVANVAFEHIAEIRGARFPGLPATDFRIHNNHRGGGAIHASPSAVKGAVVGKRQDTFGFKVDYEVHNRLGTPSSGAYDEMSRILADDWNHRVTAEQDIGDYIGLADFGYMGYLQTRVSPETTAFNTSFENADTCEA